MNIFYFVSNFRHNYCVQVGASLPFHLTPETEAVSATLC
jgi:hypothetical protein